MFKQYDLEGLPFEALPFIGVTYKGMHSYTVPVQGAVAYMYLVCAECAGQMFIKCVYLPYHSTGSALKTRCDNN